MNRIAKKSGRVEALNPFPETEGQKETYFKTFDSRRWGFISWGQSRIKGALQQQAKNVLDANSAEEALANVDYVPKEPIERALMDIYGRVGSAFGMEIYNSFKGFAPTMQTKEVEESMFVQFMRGWIQTVGTLRINAITNTTRNRLRVALQEAVDEGMGIEEAARLISERSSIIGIQRARLIARTEIISASNRGSLEGARRTNLNLDKEWISTRDSRTRRIADGDVADHYTVDGQKAPLDGKFEVPNVNLGIEYLDHPGDPTASAATVIQCRCTQGYVRR